MQIQKKKSVLCGPFRVPYPNTSFCHLGPPLATGACMLAAKQNDTVVSQADTNMCSLYNEHEQWIQCRAGVPSVGEHAVHTGPLLLSPSLSDRLMSTNTRPMSSSRLLGSFKDKSSSLALEHIDQREHHVKLCWHDVREKLFLLPGEAELNT